MKRIFPSACAAAVIAGLSASFAGPAAANADKSDIDGIWQAQGYGFWLSVTGEEATIDQITAGGCVSMASIKSVIRDGAVARLQDITLNGMGGALGPLQGELTLEEDRLLLDLGKANLISFTRADALPESCTNRPGSDALASFDVLWHGFQEHYAYFDLRGVNWDEMRATYRPQVTAETDDETLLNIFIQMLGPLRDGHVSLITPEGQIADDVLPEWAEGLEAEQMVNVVRNAFTLHAPEGTRPASSMGLGMTAEGLGYMTLINFDDALVAGEVTMASIMGELLTAEPKMKALVIDTRVNFGGSDLAGYALAAQLTSDSVEIGNKAVWEQGRWHTDTPLTIQPANAHVWDGPVYLLTSGVTISAAETFALALSHFDNVTLVGAPSNGILSDMSFLTLPNGWAVSLSNERYLNAAGENFEGAGVPVDIAVPVLPEEIAAGRDRAYEAVLQHLAQN
ncbi:S41 family peptidase [Thalassobius sp. MITS945101]|uniref:S41 family peptidase n=1 Tax=Thalassobius sp. MITS945101 TaxID=3096994 RepID=UPI0039999892